MKFITSLVVIILSIYLSLNANEPEQKEIMTLHGQPVFFDEHGFFTLKNLTECPCNNVEHKIYYDPVYIEQFLPDEEA